MMSTTDDERMFPNNMTPAKAYLQGMYDENSLIMGRIPHVIDKLLNDLDVLEMAEPGVVRGVTQAKNRIITALER